MSRRRRNDEPRVDEALEDPSRRNFLKGAGIGAASVATGTAAAPLAATAAPKALKTRGADETITVCPFCGVGCGQIAYTKGDELIHIEGDADHPVSEGALCSKGAALGQVTNNPRRLREVMYRAPGTSKFEPRSWEWAFARIAESIFHQQLFAE